MENSSLTEFHVAFAPVQVGEERPRPPMTQYLKHFVKKLDPENVVPQPPAAGDNYREQRVGTPKDKQ